MKNLEDLRISGKSLELLSELAELAESYEVIGWVDNSQSWSNFFIWNDIENCIRKHITWRK